MDDFLKFKFFSDFSDLMDRANKFNFFSSKKFELKIENYLATEQKMTKNRR